MKTQIYKLQGKKGLFDKKFTKCLTALAKI